MKELIKDVVTIELLNMVDKPYSYTDTEDLPVDLWIDETKDPTTEKSMGSYMPHLGE